MRNYLYVALFLALPAIAAERKFDFTDVRENQMPPGFRSAVTGEGKPGDWKVILDEVPSPLPPLTTEATAHTKSPVLAQLAQDPADEHFPILIYEPEIFSDFTFTTRFKTVRGTAEQMAGIAFRIQNESNYYVLRASSLGNTFKFYKVVNGQRSNPLGPQVSIPSGVWQELSVQCEGNRIRCRLDGKDVIPPLVDDSFLRGKIGFWTKSDSISYFTDARIVYTPLEPGAQKILRGLLKKYPRLVNLKIYVPGKEPGTTRVVASRIEQDVGQSGTKTEQAVIATGQIYYGKEKDSVSVIMPLRDRNGDVIAAARVIMQTFAGQTEENAIVRATPFVKEIQANITSLADLVE
jgi:hypothetical protein